MPGIRKILFCTFACLFISGCTTALMPNATLPSDITKLTANPPSCEKLRERLLHIAPVGTPAKQTTGLLESEGFTCQRTGANGQTIYATRTDQHSYWTSKRWMVLCTLDQDKVVEFTVTQGK